MSTKAFEPHPDAEVRRQSAINLIKAILPLEIYAAHKRKFLLNCLWKLAEAEGKNKLALRYRSRKSLKADKKELRHEHVVPRKTMVEALLAHPDRVDEITKDAVDAWSKRQSMRSWHASTGNFRTRTVGSGTSLRRST